MLPSHKFDTTSPHRENLEPHDWQVGSAQDRDTLFCDTLVNTTTRFQHSGVFFSTLGKDNLREMGVWHCMRHTPTRTRWIHDTLMHALA